MLLKVFCLIVLSSTVLAQDYMHGVTFRPKPKLSLRAPSICCAAPELADEKVLAECTALSPKPPCNDIKCIYEKSGWLNKDNSLNKEAYRKYLNEWRKSNKEWSLVVDKVIADCIDKEVYAYEKDCKAYDVYTCTFMSFVKKCPQSAWKC